MCVWINVMDEDFLFDICQVINSQSMQIFCVHSGMYIWFSEKNIFLFIFTFYIFCYNPKR